MEVVTLEDNRDYIVLDTINIDGIKYIYMVLATSEKEKSVCIRKLVDNEENIAGLDTEEEYKKALDAYIEKYKDIVCAS